MIGTFAHSPFRRPLPTDYAWSKSPPEVRRYSDATLSLPFQPDKSAGGTGVSMPLVMAKRNPFSIVLIVPRPGSLRVRGAGNEQRNAHDPA
jgi:hypothetical protein